MKITKVEPIFIAVPYEHGGPKQMRPLGPWTRMETLFVRLDTDAGISGYGEIFTSSLFTRPLTANSKIKLSATTAMHAHTNSGRIPSLLPVTPMKRSALS